MRTTYSFNRRGGHCPGHVRETFLLALEAYCDWEPGDLEPSVEFEVKYEPRMILLSKAAGLVWNCNDILPSDVMQTIGGTDLEPLVKRCTYASAARAIVQRIREHRKVGG